MSPALCRSTEAVSVKKEEVKPGPEAHTHTHTHSLQADSSDPWMLSEESGQRNELRLSG